MDSLSAEKVDARASAFATLRRMAAARKRAEAVKERCELCGMALFPEHRHLLEMEKHRITCACDPCALRFENVMGGRFKLIPRDVRVLRDFQVSDAQWDELGLPINLAFFVQSTPAKRTLALYPSPAGATESLLPLSAWDSLVAANPVLADISPDVEALLVNRVGERPLYFVAPIDTCFELVGMIRLHWRGLSGGEEVWREIARFFVVTEERAIPFREVSHA